MYDVNQHLPSLNSQRHGAFSSAAFRRVFTFFNSHGTRPRFSLSIYEFAFAPSTIDKFSHFFFKVVFSGALSRFGSIVILATEDRSR